MKKGSVGTAKPLASDVVCRCLCWLFHLCMSCHKEREKTGVMCGLLQFICTFLRLSQSAASFRTLQALYAKFLKAAVKFVTTVRPSIHMEQLGSHWTDFH